MSELKTTELDYFDKNEGELMHDALDSILNEVGSSLKDLAPQGCICCDVGAGREILALDQYQPKIFIASEPEYYQPELDELQLQKVVSAIPTVKLLRTIPHKALEIISKSKQPVGLITWLNIFPDPAGFVDYKGFFKLAKSLLIDNGVAIASVGIGGQDFDESEHGTELVKAAFLIEELGYKIDLPDRKKGLTTAGGLFLVATKLPKSNFPIKS